jgi:divalent metal cation (Fe/Co/Zn/Cd) transporter
MRTTDLRRLALGLLCVTIVYNVVEGVIAMGAGLSAGSLVLVVFGADSYLEVLAAGAVIWRFSLANEKDGERAERRVMRLIGWTFLLLAAAVVVDSVGSLIQHDGADRSFAGIVLLVASLVVMPALVLIKLWTAARLGMPVIAAEAKETVACSYLSLTALVGVVATAAVGAWWVDAVAALCMTPWLFREGLEGIRGEACFDDLKACFCRHCFFGFRGCPELDSCLPRCC